MPFFKQYFQLWYVSQIICILLQSHSYGILWISLNICITSWVDGLVLSFGNKLVTWTKGYQDVCCQWDFATSVGVNSWVGVEFNSNSRVGVGIGVETSGVGVGVRVDILEIRRSWNWSWSWNSQSWNWSCSWNSQSWNSSWNSPELELELKLCQRFFIHILFETYGFENWVHHIMPNNKTVSLTGIAFSEVLKYKDHDFFDFVYTIQGEIFCPLDLDHRGIVLRSHREIERVCMSSLFHWYN